MPWYGWVLVGIGLMVLGYLKLKVWTKMTKAKAEEEKEFNKIRDED